MQRHSILAMVFGLAALILLIGCNKAQSPSDQSVLGGVQSLATAMAGGARIEKPFQQQLSGAECYGGGGGKYAGDVAFGFPSRANRILAFTIGPLSDGFSPGQENNKPYAGAGAYPNVGITLRHHHRQSRPAEWIFCLQRRQRCRKLGLRAQALKNCRIA